MKTKSHPCYFPSYLIGTMCQWIGFGFSRNKTLIKSSLNGKGTSESNGAGCLQKGLSQPLNNWSLSECFGFPLITATDSSLEHYLKKKTHNIFNYLFTYLVKTYMTTLLETKKNESFDESFLYSIFPEPADCCYLSYAEFRMPGLKSITSIGNLRISGRLVKIHEAVSLIILLVSPSWHMVSLNFNQPGSYGGDTAGIIPSCCNQQMPRHNISFIAQICLNTNHRNSHN